MLSSVLLAASLIFAASAQQFGYAVDIDQRGTTSFFTCLQSNWYSVVFIRAYRSSAGGEVDENAVSNVNLAYQAGLGREVYMSPSPTSTKTAITQVDEAIAALNRGGITVRTLWISVTPKVSWNTNMATNFNFIKSATDRLRTRGIRPGVYTNYNDWQQIIGNSGSLSADVQLSSPDFSDFRPFANWNRPAVKRFGQTENVCGLTVNRDVYPLASVAMKKNFVKQSAVDNHIYVGSIGL